MWRYPRATDSQSKSANSNIAWNFCNKSSWSPLRKSLLESLSDWHWYAASHSKSRSPGNVEAQNKNQIKLPISRVHKCQISGLMRGDISTINALCYKTWSWYFYCYEYYSRSLWAQGKVRIAVRSNISNSKASLKNKNKIVSMVWYMAPYHGY